MLLEQSDAVVARQADLVPDWQAIKELCRLSQPSGGADPSSEVETAHADALDRASRAGHQVSELTGRLHRRRNEQVKRAAQRVLDASDVQRGIRPVLSSVIAMKAGCNGRLDAYIQKGAGQLEAALSKAKDNADHCQLDWQMVVRSQQSDLDKLNLRRFA